MQKPVLLKTINEKCTIHSYPLTGGLSTFHKYLACNNGYCTFYDTLKLAETDLQKIT